MTWIRATIYGLAALHLQISGGDSGAVATAVGFALMLSLRPWIDRPARNDLWLVLELLVLWQIVRDNSLRSLYFPFVVLCSATYGLKGALLGGLLGTLGTESAYLGGNLALTGLLATSLTTQERRSQQLEFDLESSQARQRSSDRLEARELEIAAEVQKALLPREVPKLDGWDFSFEMMPARVVGGDLVQFFRVDDRVGCVVADVSGKGIPAAILVGSLHQLLHRVGHLTLPEALNEINRTISATAPAGFSVALVFLWLDTATGQVEWINAGSPYPLCRRASTGQVESWESHDLCAGWDPDTAFTVHTNQLQPGDTLLVFTDGLTDLETVPGQRHGEDRIREVIKQDHRSLSNLAGSLMDLAGSAIRSDDVTFLAIRWRL